MGAKGLDTANRGEIRGLSSEEVIASRRKNGENSLPRGKKKTFLGRYIEGFSDPIIRILLFACILNIVFSIGHVDWYETVGIVSAVMISTVVSAVSEHGSERAFEKLSERADGEVCRVIRGGEVTEVRVSELVVGDAVPLGAGEGVPADGILISGRLSVEESALSGEARSEKKTPTGKNTLLRASTVTEGSGVMRVTAVGGGTVYGSIAASLVKDKRDSPLKHRLGELAKSVSMIGYAAAGVVFFATVFREIFIENGMVWELAKEALCDTEGLFRILLSALTLSISILVVAVPEGLPMMITVVLSSNMKRMLSDNVLVKKLVGIETAGSLNILFCDKTGTLTCGNFAVTEIFTAEGAFPSFQKLKRCERIGEMFSLSCIYNTESAVGRRGGRKCALGGNATDRALLSAVMSGRDSADGSKNGIRVVDRLPFDSKNKYSAVTLDIGGKRLTLIKGAPEIILSRCRSELTESGATEFISKSDIERIYKSRSEDGARLVAAAFYEGETDIRRGELPYGAVFTALVSITDEVRREAKSAVAEIKGAGIEVVMITGDSGGTAGAIAKKTGILSSADERMISGESLRRMTDAELTELLPSLRVVYRALPSDKERLVSVSQSAGYVVGMTGDGVNDAPALKRSDVGFALGGGTEVAKEAGDIVILDGNIKSIGRAVLYGRTIFDSIRKFIVFQLTMNLCAVGVSIIGPFVGVEAPVTVIQMLWVNLIMDTLGGLAFAGEAPRAEYMKEKPKRRDEKILSGAEISRVIFTGGFAVIMSLLYLKLPFLREHFGYGTDTGRFVTVFFAAFVFCGIFTAFNCRTSRIDLFSHLSENKAFIFIMAVTAFVQLLIVYFGGDVFRTVPLSAEDLLSALVMAFSVIPFDISRKLIIRHRKKRNTV